jgi:hypothetical protein
MQKRASIMFRKSKTLEVLRKIIKMVLCLLFMHFFKGKKRILVAPKIHQDPLFSLENGHSNSCHQTKKANVCLQSEIVTSYVIVYFIHLYRIDHSFIDTYRMTLLLLRLIMTVCRADTEG